MQLNTSSSPAVGGSNTIRPFTRAIAAIIIPFLVAAFVILYFFPAQSGARFAWQIEPPLTAAWMGAGYLGGAYLFIRVALGGRWHRVAPGFWPVTAFTWGMLLATVLHWSRFDLSHLPFQIWLVLYIVTPFLVPFVWWRNRAADPGVPEPADLEVPVWARATMAAVGVGMAISCLVAFVWPAAAIAAWPWPLSILTARIMGGWFALMSVGGFGMALERRWSAWLYPVESIIFVWHGLMLVAAVVHRSYFKPGGIWFVAAEAAAIVALGAFYTTMQRRRQGA